MFRRILVPVDLSERAAEPARMAGLLARVHGADVTLLHVVETLDVPHDEVRDFYGDLELKAKARLEQLAESLRAEGLTVDQLVRYGKRTQVIVEQADGGDFDLVVIGSHRLTRDNFASGFMTISHQVAVVAHTPVLIIKH